MPLCDLSESQALEVAISSIGNVQLPRIILGLNSAQVSKTAFPTTERKLRM